MSTQLKDAIPIFCIARIPKEVLEKFLTLSHEVPELLEQEGPGVLIDSENISQITSYATAPLQTDPSYPFLGWDVKRVIEWAEKRLDRWRDGISQHELVILDQQTPQDMTCLLVTVKEGEHAKHPDNPERLLVRADFKSSLVTLNVKVQGVGGDGHFETNVPDGVVRHYE